MKRNQGIPIFSLTKSLGDDTIETLLVDHFYLLS